MNIDISIDKSWLYDLAVAEGDIKAWLCTQLIKCRKREKLTQKQLGDKIGRSQSYVSKVEDGEIELTVIEFVKYALHVKLNAALAVGAMTLPFLKDETFPEL
jgi:transcriptional regulator with XRE-family HTH domain